MIKMDQDTVIRFQRYFQKRKKTGHPHTITCPPYPVPPPFSSSESSPPGVSPLIKTRSDEADRRLSATVAVFVHPSSWALKIM
jgi:hypothetical protein